MRSSSVGGLGAGLRTKVRASVGEQVSSCDAPQDVEVVEGEISIDSSTLSIPSLLGCGLIGCFEFAPVVGMISGRWRISQ
jgi:hypothetical protein